MLQSGRLYATGKPYRVGRNAHLPQRVRLQKLQSGNVSDANYLSMPLGIPVALNRCRNATMLRLKPRQRAALSETLRELAHLAAGVLVLGQFIGEQPPSLWLILVGGAIWAALVALGLVLSGDQQW